MINNFILQKSDMINLSEVENVNNLEDITTEILKSVKDSTSPTIDTIKAIEKYNTDHNLPLEKRITYWITFASNPILLHTLHTEFRAKFAEVTYFIGSGTVDAKYNATTMVGGVPRATEFKQGLITAVIPLEQIFAVSFGSYNTETIDSILYPNTNKIPDIEIKLRKELSTLNSLKSDTKIRDFIIEFNRFMHQPGMNEVTNYNYNREAYNLYTTLWKTYLNKVENIVDHFEANTIPDPEIRLFNTVNNDTVENYKKILE